jgi:diphthine-ammonia ligase
MIDYPLNAIIIKVASYGLKIEHLGKSIEQLYPFFMKLKGECGMNVCG